MTLLTSIIGGGSSGGGGTTAVVGEYKPVITGNTRQLGIANTANANTITESGGGVWIRSGQVYKQSSYPELFARIGYVNAQIGISKTMNTNPGFSGNTVAIAYDPENDLYVIPVSSNGGNVALTNSSMQSFSYKTVGGSNTTYYNSIAFGGANGAKRFVIASNGGAYILYGSNGTVSGPGSGSMNSTTTPATPTLYNDINVIFGAANTISNTIVILFSANTGTINVSSDSGVSYSAVNSNTIGVYDMAYGNGVYVMVPLRSTGWVETSTNGSKWTGMQKQQGASGNTNQWSRRFVTKFAQAAGNVLIAAMNDSTTSGNFTSQGGNYFYFSHFPSPGVHNGNYHSGGHHVVFMPFYAASNSNIYEATIYTTTDARSWDVRGFVPAYAGGQHGNQPSHSNVTPYLGPGANKITAVGNGANTVIASTALYNFQYTQAFYTGNHNCHNHYDHDHGHFVFHCAAEQGPATGVSEDRKYNLVYTANAAVTNTPASNIWVLAGNCAVQHNAQTVTAFAYGAQASGTTYYVYGTDGGGLASSSDGYSWTNRTNPSGSKINAITYGRANSTNTFMAVGASGLIATATDVGTWTSRTTAYATDSAGWGSVAFGNNIFILAGNTGNIALSNDGVNFSGVNALTTVISSAYGSNTFVIGMAGGIIKSSIDGVFWTNTGSSGVGTEIQSIATDNTKFVYVGMGGATRYTTNLSNAWTAATITSSNNHYSVYWSNTDSKWLLGGANGSIFTSTDGITWTNRNSGTSNTILSVFYANGVYFYGGDNVLATSSDATTWTIRNANSTGYYLRISGFAYGNGQYVYAGQGQYGTSTDGVTWISVPAGARDTTNINVANTVYTGQINDIMYNTTNNTFVAVGAGGYIATSGNGTGWTLQNSRTGQDFTSMTYGNNRYLAVGSGGTTKISKNAISWSGHASNANVWSVAFYPNNNTFIMVGMTKSNGTQNVAVQSNTYTLETSTDGVYWDTRVWKTTIPPGYAAASNTIAGVMEINNDGTYAYPAVGWPAGDNRVSTSTDGVLWHGLGLPANSVAAVSYANGKFFATSRDGLIASSNDGVYWTTTNITSQFATSAGLGDSANVVPAYTGGITNINWATSFGALKFHPGTQTYILPHRQGIVHLTSKDLVTWTPRYALPFNLWNSYLVDGPFIVSQVSGGTITYTTSANNYISASYNVASEFYVPLITSSAYTTHGGWVVGPNFYPTPQTQTYENADTIWYIKAKT